jgi:CDP-paratose synthetase
MSKTVLLTGGTGFLGSHIVKSLINENFKVIVVKRSSSKLFRLEPILDKLVFYDIDLICLEKIFQDNAIDMIVHCATNYGRALIPPTDIIKANLFLPLELLQLAKIYQLKSFVNTDTLLDKRVNNYSLSKKQFLDWLTLFSKDLTCVNVALEHFYGPFDDRSKFVSKIILDLLNNVDCIDLTPGEQKRDFIYIDDVVDAFMKLINFSLNIAKGLYCYEIGTGKTVTIKEFVQLTNTLTGNKVTKLKFGSLPYRENEIMNSYVDLSKLLELGWQPKVALIEGLKYTIQMEKRFLNQ